MKSLTLTEGSGRTGVTLMIDPIGDDLVVRIFNERGHLGAVALAEYSHAEGRTSTSVITRLGHKDDRVAAEVAHDLSSHFRKPVCVVAGIHLDNITLAEIDEILENCRKLARTAGPMCSVEESATKTPPVS